MPSICFYFQVHQPNRLKQYTFFDLGHDHSYENESFNRDVVHKVSDSCYLPTNNLMLKLIKEHKGKFKIAFSLSGVVMEQFEKYRPDVLESFKELANTGNVEFLAETYYHSLSFFYSKEEFKRQVKMHTRKIKNFFGQTPKVFRNTELAYNNDLARYAEQMGFKGIVTEGVDRLLFGQTPNVLYHPPKSGKIKLLLRNHKLSDDLGFRFSDKNWEEFPLTPDKFAGWLAKNKGEIVNLFMDYESIGEHQWEDTGIFNFFQELPSKILKKRNLDFVTPSQAINKYKSWAIYDIHNAISWADYERDLSAWNGNTMQFEAIKKVFQLEKLVKSSRNKDLIHVWSKLQTSDHFYYMSTKGHTDGMVHNYFSPYNSPYDGYIYYMNALSDLEILLNKRNRKKLVAHH
jgi:alpha-amylase